MLMVSYFSILLSLLTATLSRTDASVTRFVDPVFGVDHFGCGTGTLSFACRSLSFAINESSYSGDVIQLAYGLYDGPNNIALNWQLKPLVIQCQRSDNDYPGNHDNECIFRQQQTGYMPYYVFSLDLSSINQSFANSVSIRNNFTLPISSSLIGLTFDQNDYAISYTGTQDNSLAHFLHVTNCSFLNGSAQAGYSPMISIQPSDSGYEQISSDLGNSSVVVLHSCYFADCSYSSSLIQITSISVSVVRCKFIRNNYFGYVYNSLISTYNSNVTIVQSSFVQQQFVLSTSYYDYWGTLNLAGTLLQMIDCVVNGSRAQPAVSVGSQARVFFLRTMFGDNSGGSIVLYNLQMPGHVSFDDCIFVNNTADTGGAISIQYSQDGSIELVNTLFLNNNASNGGAIYAVAPFSAIVTNCTFQSNTAVQGGAVFVDMGAPNTGSIIFKASHFRANIASEGGAIRASCSSESVLRVENCSFIENSASLSGGALKLKISMTNYTFAQCVFHSNHASVGGAVYLQAGSHLALDDSEWFSNRAVSGGAVFAENGVQCALVSSTFVHNTASDSGGAVISQLGDFTFTQITFQENSAVTGAALYFPAVTVMVSAAKCHTIMDNVHFIGNVASKSGGGIYFARSASDFSCPNFCDLIVNSYLTPAQAIELTDANIFNTSECYFSSNVAGLGYGLNIAAPIKSVQIVGLNTSQNSQPSSVKCYPGLPFDVVVQAVDSLGRLLRLSNGGSYGVLMQIDLIQYSTINNGSVSYQAFSNTRVLTGLTSLPVAKGQVHFDLAALYPPSSDSVHYQLVVTSDPISSTTILPLVISPCPVDLGYLTVVSADGATYECIPRPLYMEGDSLNVEIGYSSVLLSLAVCMLGIWTSLFLIEQSIVSGSRAGQQMRSKLYSSMSALVYGVVGVWSSQVLGLSTLQVGFSSSPLTVDLHTSLLFTGLALLIVGSLITFLLIMRNKVFSGDDEVETTNKVGWDAQVDRFRGNLIFRQAELSDVFESQTASVSSVSSMLSSNGRTRVHSVSGNSDEKSSVECAQLNAAGVKSSAPTAAVPLNHLHRTRTSRQQAELQNLLGNEIRSPLMLGTLTVLWLLFTLSDFIVVSSAQPHSASPTFQPLPMTLTLGFSYLLFIPSMLAYFLYFRRFRLYLVPILTAIRSLFYLTTLTTVQWHYTLSVNSGRWVGNGDLIGVSGLNLAIFVVALFVCAGCIVLNIKALKLSQHEIAATLHKMSQHLGRLRQTNEQIQHQNQILQTSVQLNAILRPLSSLTGAALDAMENDSKELLNGRSVNIREICSPSFAVALKLVGSQLPLISSSSDIDTITETLDAWIKVSELDTASAAVVARGASSASRCVQLPGSTTSTPDDELDYPSDESSSTSSFFLKSNQSTKPDSQRVENNGKSPMKIHKDPLAHTLLRRFSLLPSLSSSAVPGLPADSLSPGAAHTRNFSSFSQVDLMTVIRHPVGVELFKDYCQQSHNAESALFCCSIMDYKQQSANKTPGIHFRLIAVQLYYIYIANGSPNEANVSATIKAEIKKRLVNWNRLTHRQRSNMFDESFEEVLQLIRTNLWLPFTKSPAYELCQLFAELHPRI